MEKIIFTIVCLAPFGNLVLDILSDASAERLLLGALLTVITVSICSAYWTLVITGQTDRYIKKWINKIRNEKKK